MPQRTLEGGRSAVEAQCSYSSTRSECPSSTPHVDTLPGFGFTLLTYFQNGESALHAACMFDHVDVARALLKYGADSDLKNAVGYFFMISLFFVLIHCTKCLDSCTFAGRKDTAGFSG